MTGEDEVITELINAWVKGDAKAGDELFLHIQKHLRRVAGKYFKQEHGYRTLQPTALVNEFVAEISGKHHLTFQNRKAFLAYAAKAMRHILMQSARKRDAPIHGGNLTKVSESDALLRDPVARDADPDALLAVDRALEKLSEIDPKAVEMVELRYFVGFNIEELTDLLEVSRSKINRDLLFARRWLAAELEEGRHEESGSRDDSRR